MRQRRNPIERRRARKPIALAWFVVALAAFVITPVAIIALSDAHSLSFHDDSAGFSFSYDTKGREPEVRTALLELLWSTATIFPLALGITAVIRGADLNRSSLKRHGWTLHSGPLDLIEGRHHSFPLAVARERGVRKLAWGTAGNLPASIYTLWTSPNHRYSVEQVELPVAFPSVMIVPTNAYDTLMVGLGGQDIRVESAAFNERWRVMSPHPAAAHAVLHPRMIERLLADDVQNMAINVDGGAVMSWWPGLTPADRALANLRVLADIVELIPQGAILQFGAPRDPLWGGHMPDYDERAGGARPATAPAPVAKAAAPTSPPQNPSQTTFLPE